MVINGHIQGHSFIHFFSFFYSVIFFAHFFLCLCLLPSSGRPRSSSPPFLLLFLLQSPASPSTSPSSPFLLTIFGDHQQHHLLPSVSFRSPASSISTDDPCRRQCKSPASHLLPLQVLEFLQLQCSSPLGHQLLHSFSSSKLVSSAALLLSCVKVSMTVCVCVPCANQKHRFLILYSAQHLSIDFIISFFLESDCCNLFICLCFDLSLLHLLVLLSS